MFDTLKDLVKQYAGDTIINNPDIPNEHNEAAVDEASHSIFSGLKNAVANGNLSDLTSMLNGGDQSVTNSPLANNIQGGFVERLTQKFGLDRGKAGQIAASLIPAVLKKFVHKTNDPGDNSFDLTKIIAEFTGGGSIANAGGTAIPNSNGKADGGLFDKVKGLFN